MPYQHLLEKTPLDQETIAQALLNIEAKTRSNPLKWNGQFSPQLIDVLLQHYAQEDFTVFDPFVGSGTVLLEAGRLGYRATGTEINPAAYYLAKTYALMNTTHTERQQIIGQVTEVLNQQFVLKLLHDFTPTTNHTKSEAAIVQQKLKAALKTMPNEQAAQLLRTLIVLLDFHKKGLTEQKVFRIWRQLQQHMMTLPHSKETIDVHWADARSTPLADNTIDLVITSPPYINVFNYHQQYRASVEFLAYDLLTIAKSEIGANRKHRSNRFLTVIQYCMDIALTFAELWRVCRTNSRIIFIVGRESTIRATPFYNGEIVAKLINDVFAQPLAQRQERRFKNRFGQMIYEDILHFYGGQTAQLAPASILDKSRLVAQYILETTYHHAPANAKDDIQTALQKIDTVNPSPLLVKNGTYQNHEKRL